jgi:hypothetical protein
MEVYYDEQQKDYSISAGVPEWEVKEVEAKDDYKLLITFVTGEKKLFDFKPLLDQVYYKELKDNEELFKKATVGGDTVVWNDEIDIAPEYLYENGTPV